ncbi:MAG: hypothetical protein QCI82_04800 [Candidatus Thermoplasmatota archaeon]|nr:hypothetical protein [Candidatus Thermoplasmatota archaeon]
MIEMPTPFFTRDLLWDKIRRISFEKRQIRALKFDNYHTITALDEEQMSYSIRFRSMKEHDLSFNDLYVIYEEVYRNGWIDENHLSRMCRKLFQRPYIINAPAMMAMLYHCDRNLLNENGILRVRDPMVLVNGPEEVNAVMDPFVGNT